MKKPNSAAIHRPQRPISFSKAMVHALLEGRKTQTRRLVAPQPARGKIENLPCRFGQPGDRPRTASRLTLEITSVRIERLKQLTSADARAEGFDPQVDFADPIQWFAQLWDSLITDGLTWRANPWVWVIGFELLSLHKITTC